MSPDPLCAVLTALEQKLREEATQKRALANARWSDADPAVRDDGARQNAYAAQLEADADRIAALLKEHAPR